MFVKMGWDNTSPSHKLKVIEEVLDGSATLWRYRPDYKKPNSESLGTTIKIEQLLYKNINILAGINFYFHINRNVTYQKISARVIDKYMDTYKDDFRKDYYNEILSFATCEAQNLRNISSTDDFDRTTSSHCVISKVIRLNALADQIDELPYIDLDNVYDFEDYRIALKEFAELQGTQEIFLRHFENVMLAILTKSKYSLAEYLRLFALLDCKQKFCKSFNCELFAEILYKKLQISHKYKI